MARLTPKPMNQFRAILRSELVQLVRDKRALFAAIVLPILLYPWLFAGQSKIEQISRDSLSERTLHAAYDLSQLPEEWQAPVLEAMEAAQPIEWSSIDASSVIALEEKPSAGDSSGAESTTEDSGEESTGEADVPPTNRTSERRALYKELLNDEQTLLLIAHRSDSKERPQIAMYFDVKEDASREAEERVSSQLNALENDRTQELRKQLLGGDPAAFLNFERVDVASAEKRTGAKLGRLLPMLLVLLLISGGAFAALTVFAGEREAGTLESILVQPIEPRVLALGKFAAVAVAAFATLLANLLALGLCVALGLTSSGDGDLGGLNPWSLVGALWYLPGALLLCGLLCMALGRARTFREGQYLLFPITLVAAIPSAVVLQPSLPNNVVLSMVPFTGAALNLRDILRGDSSLLLLLVMTVSHLAWTGWTVQRIGRMLDGERALSASSDVQKFAKQGPARHGMRWGFAGVLTWYLVSGWIQSRYPITGFAWTLWIMMPGMALVCALRAKQRSNLPGLRSQPYSGLSHELGLRIGKPQYWLAALLMVPALTLGMRHFGELQMKLLPLPNVFSQSGGILETFFAMSDWKIFFLMAISPAVCEELFFRGALLSSLRRGMSAPKAVMWQTIFFAAAHASVHRLMPTAIIGVILGIMTLRARSIVPAILCHAAYNASMIFQETGTIPGLQRQEGTNFHTQLAWLALLGIAIWWFPKVRKTEQA